MSYANHYILSTISQLQPDQETVFAYDIKMGNIQQLVRELGSYDQEQLLVYDANGTIIGSTEEAYLGSTLTAGAAAAQTALQQAQAAMEALEEGTEAWQKAKEQAEAAKPSLSFAGKASMASDLTRSAAEGFADQAGFAAGLRLSQPRRRLSNSDSGAAGVSARRHLRRSGCFRS